MSASRVRAAFAGLLIWALAAPALAQSREPIRLWPPASDKPELSRPDAGSWRPARPERREKTAIEQEVLAPLDRDFIGTLDTRRGLGAKLWANSRRGVVLDLMQKLPPTIELGGLHDLVRRALLTGAPLPEGGGAGANALAIRAAALASIGAADDASDLVRAAGTRDDDETLARITLDLALLRFDLSTACKTAESGVRSSTDPYWQKALIYCQAQSGERDRAALGLSLLRDSKHDDPTYFSLIDVIMGNDGDGPYDRGPASPLLLAMLRSAGKRIPGEFIADAKPALLRTIATSPNVDPDLRLAAAERAVAAQAIDGGVLAALYEKVEAPAQPVAATEGRWGPRERAALFQSAARQADPAARAGTLKRLWALARERGGYEATVRAALPLIEPMRPGGRLGFFAADAARAWFLAGDLERAEEWVAILEREAPGNSQAAAGLAELMPLMALASADKGFWTDAEISRWLGSEPSSRQAPLVFALLDGLDTPVPQKAWVGLREAGPAPASASALRSLQDAAADRRRGETILDAAIAGADRQAWTNPAVVRSIVVALRKVGLETEARRLAIEAVIMSGLPG